MTKMLHCVASIADDGTVDAHCRAQLGTALALFEDTLGKTRDRVVMFEMEVETYNPQETNRKAYAMVHNGDFVPYADRPLLKPIIRPKSIEERVAELEAIVAELQGVTS